MIILDVCRLSLGAILAADTLRATSKLYIGMKDVKTTNRVKTTLEEHMDLLVGVAHMITLLFLKWKVKGFQESSSCPRNSSRFPSQRCTIPVAGWRITAYETNCALLRMSTKAQPSVAVATSCIT